MKYGRILYGRNAAEGKNQYVNLGDDFQAFALDNLYRYMGVPESEVISIRRTEITLYDGEDVFLPFQGCFIHTKGAPIFPISSHIKPAFFGFHCLYPKDISYIRQFPQDTFLGCRDESTFHLVEKHSKNAFLSGCLTIALPKRQDSIKGSKVFLIDAPEGIENFMPNNLKEDATFLPQSVHVDDNIPYEQSFELFEQMAHERLDLIKNTASLVVTSRLHVASPCIAMGIPVILARKYFDERYSWIDSFLPLYTPSDFANINWNPLPVDIEDHKKLVLNTAKAIINDEPDKNEYVNQLHNFYMSRNKIKVGRPFYTRIYHYMLGTFPKTANFIREVVLQKFTIETARNKQLDK